MIFLFVYWSLIFCSYCVATKELPAHCYGPIPRIFEGEYFFHDNETYQLRLTTNVNLKMDLRHRSCFQVDLEHSDNESNQTLKVQSLFYSFEYSAFLHHYPVRTSYQFGIPEFQSSCKCDCPNADEFCNYAIDRKECSRPEICIQKYHVNQNSYGCPDSGPAALCCEIWVKPYENLRFTAVNLGTPISEAIISIDIFALYRDSWNLFRRYRRKLLPYQGNSLHLNGYENVADMFIFAQAGEARFKLDTADKYYYFSEANSSGKKFTLFDGPKLNDIHDFNVNHYGWLRYESNAWVIHDPRTILPELHRPIVTNCKQQTYTDRYDINSRLKVIRNSTGAINEAPFMGDEIIKREQSIKEVSLTSTAGVRNSVVLTIAHDTSSAPTLRLDLALQQRLNIITHMHTSYLEHFICKISLDKHSNRFLNITLIQAYGQFMIEIYQDGFKHEEVDLILTVTTNLPFSSNYRETLPLPGHINTPRFVCVISVQKVKQRLCQWANFEREKVEWFELKNIFIATEGQCPGCNQEKDKGFWANLDPRNWFNGIHSVSEAVAMAVEIAIYFLLFILVVVIFRKVICPLLKWALCSKSRVKEDDDTNYVYKKCHKTESDLSVTV